MVTDYKSLYVDLADDLNNLYCSVNDLDYLGYCYTNNERYKAHIFINPKLTYKEKYFVLLHEAGHLFYMKKGQIFNWSKKKRNETQANWFAVQFLRMNDLDTEDYKRFYKRASKRKHNKPWFQV